MLRDGLQTLMRGRNSVDEQIMQRKVARRRLLRRAGTVAAGVAGAGAVAAALPTPAQANPGDAMIVGTSNNGGGSITGLFNTALNGPTLGLANNATTAGTGGLTAGIGPLQLTPNGDFAWGAVGTLGVSTDGTLWQIVPYTGGTYSDFVRNGGNSTVVRTFSPVRILDTRSDRAGGKQCIMNPDALDAAGNIKENTVLNINLDAMFVFAYSILCNITVVAQGGGYVTLYPGGAPRPNASNVNYQPGSVLANFAVAGLGQIDPAVNALSIYAFGATKVILDVCGAVVNYADDIKPISGSPGFEAASTPERVRPAHLMPQRTVG
jgi:hypothetical protein